jgi:hypothetical protein
MTINSVAERVLRDAEFYLDALDSEVYRMPLDLLFGASIGQHTRHFIEFYRCLLLQIDQPGGVVNYSKRERDLAIETDPQVAQRHITEIAEKLTGIDANRSCLLECDDHIDGESNTVESNLERELLYNIEHTIHHLAIIKIGLAAVAPSIEIPEHFGVAPSTIKHKQNICAQ